jgi:hypothetical protein
VRAYGRLGGLGRFGRLGGLGRFGRLGVTRATAAYSLEHHGPARWRRDIDHAVPAARAAKGDTSTGETRITFNSCSEMTTDGIRATDMKHNLATPSKC